MVIMPTVPVFPLNTVLFPSMPLHLHIFEDRYKQMVKECVDQNEPFGVTLIQSGTEVAHPYMPTHPHLIGCLAQIKRVHPLNAGKLNIDAVGTDRFRILQLDYSYPYLAANIEYMPMERTVSQLANERVIQLRKMIEQYLQRLTKTRNTPDIRENNLPNAPHHIAYFAAMILKVDAIEKQQLLESPDVSTLINRLYKSYRHELIINQVMENEPDTKSNAFPFSSN